MKRFPWAAFYLFIATIPASFIPAQATQPATVSAEAAESGEQELVLIEKANKGDASAAFNLGYSYYTQQNYPGAIRWYGKAAELGNARAAFEIAIIYRDGLLGEPDMKKMISYLQQAAKQGLVLAQTELAVSYLQGTGVDKNEQTAMYWYEQAAKQGDAEAQYYLGHLYWKKQDIQIGFMDSDGQSYRVTADGITIKIDPRYESNDKKAVYWLCQAAEHNYGDAQLELSHLYGHEYAIGAKSGDIMVNIKQRDLWLQKAADNGVERAKQELANNSVPWYTAAEKWAKDLFEPTEQATCPYDASVLQ